MSIPRSIALLMYYKSPKMSPAKDAREGKAVPSFHKTPPYACHPYGQYVLDTTMHKQTQIGTEHRFNFVE
jgi:hypothetical protein